MTKYVLLAFLILGAILFWFAPAVEPRLAMLLGAAYGFALTNFVWWNA